MIKDQTISQTEFNELCKYICCQITPSGSKTLDIEALNFAIYWQLCCLLDQKVIPDNFRHAKITGYRQSLQTLLNDYGANDFDALQIVDNNINEIIDSKYESWSTYVYENFQELIAA